MILPPPVTPAPLIAFYLPHLRTGGAETVFVRLAAELERLGYQICFVLDRRQGQLLERVTVPVEELAAPRSLAAVPRLAGWLRRRRPDLLFSALGPNNIVALLAVRLAGVPTRVVVGEHSLLSRRTDKTWQHRMVPLLARLFYPQAAAVVAVSTAGRRDLAAILGPRVDVETIFNPAVGTDAEARAAKPLSHPWLAEGETLPVILAAGRLEPVKNFPLLLEAFADLTARQPARLIILGEGNERAHLEQLRDRLGLAGQLDLPGVVDDPMPWFARARLVAMTSHYEGFGLVLVEAMACGTPVVTTEGGGPPAEIVLEGELAPVVPCGDRQALAEALRQTLETPVDAARLKRRAADFSLASSVAAYAALIERVRRRGDASQAGGALKQEGSMSFPAIAECLYKAKERFRPLRHLLPRSLRKKIFSVIANRAVQEVPARIFMHETIFPALLRQGGRRMLFVGTQSYNLEFYRQCEARNVAVWTIDYDPQSARWGSPRGHFTGDIREVDRLVGDLRFDLIIFNGILGFGINTEEDAGKTIDALSRVADPEAWLMVGWNPGRTDDGEIQAFRRRLPSTAPAPLEAAIEFPPFGQVQPYPHRYEFFRFPPVPAI